MSINTPNSTLHIDLSESSEREGFVFISYKNEEAELAENFQKVLKNAGFSVWWDKQIQCGQAWNQILDNAVKQASCIIVLWSMHSTKSNWVLHEASVALARNNYAPVRIELCSIPSPYNQIQATDIIDWDGMNDHPGVRDLLERCNSLVPKSRSKLSQFTEALWIHRVSVTGILFGLIALSILVWQTKTSSSQLHRLDSIAKQQTKSTASLDTFRQHTDSSVTSQLKRFDAIFKEETKLFAKQNLTLQSITDLQNPLFPLKINFRFEINLDTSLNKELSEKLNEIKNYCKGFQPNELNFDNNNLIIKNHSLYNCNFKNELLKSLIEFYNLVVPEPMISFYKSASFNNVIQEKDEFYKIYGFIPIFNIGTSKMLYTFLKDYTVNLKYYPYQNFIKGNILFEPLQLSEYGNQFISLYTLINGCYIMDLRRDKLSYFAQNNDLRIDYITFYCGDKFPQLYHSHFDSKEYKIYEGKRYYYRTIKSLINKTDDSSIDLLFDSD